MTSCGCWGAQVCEDDDETDEGEKLTDTDDEAPQSRASADETWAEDSGLSAAQPHQLQPNQVESNQASTSAAQGNRGACLGPSAELPGSVVSGRVPEVDVELSELAAAIGALNDSRGEDSNDVRQEPSAREGAADGEVCSSAGGEAERLRGGESDLSRQQAAMQVRDRGEAVVRTEGGGFQALLQHLSSNLDRAEVEQHGGQAAAVRRVGPAAGEDLRASGRFLEASQGDSAPRSLAEPPVPRPSCLSAHRSSSSGSNISARSDSGGSGGGSHSSLSPADSSPVREVKKTCKLRVFRRQQIEVADCIGKGAYGSVWQAYLLDEQSQERRDVDCVVVKVVWPDTDLDPAEVAEFGTPIRQRMLAFQREIEMMELTGRHPNIVKILGATRDSRVIVFEQAWTDLQALLRRQPGGVSLPYVSKWVYDILVGVEYLHSVHMVHRDLKPANILVSPDMTAKIGDFGMARTFSPRSRMAVSREICTLWYRAPELLMGSLTYDVKVDEWAVGCLTIEMLCGQNAMPGQNEDRSGRTCSCGQVAHLNHNLDQLVLVFTLLGSPPHSFLQRYPCYEHFEDWDDTECSLSLFLHQIGVFNRANPMSRAPPVGAPVEFAELIANDWSKTACSERNWMEVLKALLCIDPDKRATATQVLEMDLFRLANEHMPSRTPALLNMRSTQASGAHQPTVPAPLSYSHADLSSLMPEQPSGLSRQSSLPLQPPLPVEETFTYGSYGASGFREGRRMQLRSSSQSRSPARVASGGSSRSPARVPRVHGAAGQASVRSSAASSVSNSPRSVRGHSPGRDAGASAAAAGGGSSRPAGTGQQASSGFERGRQNVREVLSAVRSRTGRRPPA